MLAEADVTDDTNVVNTETKVNTEPQLDIVMDVTMYW